jgi:predicted nucleotidyltransferase
MPITADIKQALRAEMPYLRRHYRVDRVGLCGSFVRGDQTDDRDVDLLMTFAQTPTLYGFVYLKYYLENALSRDVDLGMPGALKEGPAADNIRRDVEYPRTYAN